MSERGEEPDGAARVLQVEKKQEMEDVRGTRRGMEKLVVVEVEQASRDRVTKFLEAARISWGKLRELVVGRKLVEGPKGECMVKELSEEVSQDELVVRLEDVAGEAGEGIVKVIEVDEVMDEDGDSVVSDDRRSLGGAALLDCIAEETKDDELENRLEGQRKRKREPIEEVKLRGLVNTRGWREREK